MSNWLSSSLFYGVVISIAAYEAGLLIRRRFKLAVLNPLLLGVIIVIGVNAILGIDYQSYNGGAQEKLYNKLNAFAGSKPICFHECGTNPTAEEFESVPWLWFMTWHTDHIINQNDTKALSELYNSERVITRDELPKMADVLQSRYDSLIKRQSGEMAEGETTRDLLDRVQKETDNENKNYQAYESPNYENHLKKAAAENAYKNKALKEAR